MKYKDIQVQFCLSKNVLNFMCKKIFRDRQISESEHLVLNVFRVLDICSDEEILAEDISIIII